MVGMECPPSPRDREPAARSHAAGGGVRAASEYSPREGEGRGIPVLLLSSVRRMGYLDGRNGGGIEDEVEANSGLARWLPAGPV